MNDTLRRSWARKKSSEVSDELLEFAEVLFLECTLGSSGAGLGMPSDELVNCQVLVSTRFCKWKKLYQCNTEQTFITSPNRHSLVPLSSVSCICYVMSKYV